MAFKRRTIYYIILSKFKQKSIIIPSLFWSFLKMNNNYYFKIINKFSNRFLGKYLLLLEFSISREPGILENSYFIYARKWEILDKNSLKKWEVRDIQKVPYLL